VNMGWPPNGAILRPFAREGNFLRPGIGAAVS
jgi:hypothetical protein